MTIAKGTSAPRIPHKVEQIIIHGRGTITKAFRVTHGFKNFEQPGNGEDREGCQQVKKDHDGKGRGPQGIRENSGKGVSFKEIPSEISVKDKATLDPRN